MPNRHKIKIKDLVFSHINIIGAMFDSYNNVPFLTYKIEIGRKEYIGFVHDIRLKNNGKDIISGTFHPFLEMNYFEAFKIYPGRFIHKKIIDINDPKEEQTFENIMCCKNMLEMISIDKSGAIDDLYPEYIEQLRLQVKDFFKLHPELNAKKTFILLEEATNIYDNYSRNKLCIDDIESEITLQCLAEIIEMAISSLLFAQE